MANCLHPIQELEYGQSPALDRRHDQKRQTGPAQGDRVNRTGDVVPNDRRTPMTDAEIIEAARQKYCVGSDDDVEIDEYPEIIHADGGCWVPAWVWIPAS